MNWIIFFIYLTPVFIIAFLSRRKRQAHGIPESLAQDHYLAGKNLGLVESTGSILATEVSALSFIGIPAIAYSSDFSLIYFYLGTIPGRFLISRLIIPRIYGKGLTLYGIMASNNSTLWARRWMAIIYSTTKILGVGVRFYAGSILVSRYFELPLPTTLFLITLITFCYTIIGGLKAVVRTDLFQTCLFIGGGIAAHFIIPSVAGEDWGSLMYQAHEAGKIVPLSFHTLKLFCIGIVGGFFFDFCTHSFDQDYTQRLLGAKTEKTAKRAILYSSFFSVNMGLLFLPLGSLLWAFYQSHPLPEGIRPDELFAHFITTYFPPYLQGFMLIGVLAGTMSTLDSTINALSSVLWNDIRPGRDMKNLHSDSLKNALIVSVLLLMVAIWAGYSDGLFVLGMKISSWSVGTFATLFFIQLIRPPGDFKLEGPVVFSSYLFNLLGVVFNSMIGGPWEWNVYYGVSFSLAFIMGVIMWKKYRNSDLRP